MATNEENIETIKAFLLGQMNAEEEQDFIQRMEADEVLAKDVLAYEKIFKGIRQKRMEDMENKIKSFESSLPQVELDTKSAKRISLGRRVWYAAASIAIIVVAIFLVNRFLPSTTDASLAIESMEIPDIRGFKGVDEAEIYLNGFNAFLDGEYDTAITDLNNFADTSEYYANAQYMLGYCYFEKGEYGLSIGAFNEALKYPGKITLLMAKDGPAIQIVETHIEWPLCLALFADERTEEANSLLTKIEANSEHPFVQEASELLKKLQALQ